MRKNRLHTPGYAAASRFAVAWDLPKRIGKHHIHLRALLILPCSNITSTALRRLKTCRNITSTAIAWCASCSRLRGDASRCLGIPRSSHSAQAGHKLGGAARPVHTSIGDGRQTAILMWSAGRHPPAMRRDMP